MRITFGADDDSPTVEAVHAHLEQRGHTVITVGQDEQWPVIAQHVAESVAAGDADLGVVMCWTGTGTSMAANKVPGARAALAWEPWIARHARMWNDANVLALSLKRTAPDVAVEIVDAFLDTTEVDADEADNIAQLDR
jgi:ribose 5-phosphate isomerase B